MTTTPGASAPAILFSTLTPDLTHEVPLGLEGMPTEVEVKVGDTKKKIPVSYFEKDAIECGDFKHPTTGQEFSIDAHRLDRWVQKFDQMRAAGVEVPCPIDHSDKAEDNRGFTLKMRRDGNKLKVTPQVFGEDGALLALRNRCSVKIEPDFVDEKGRHWGECISHVSFTHVPVISGQGPFVPIAASRGQQSVPVYYLSASSQQQEVQMDLTQLRTSLGADSKLADEKLIELAIAKLNDGKKAATDLADVQTKLSKAEEKVVSLSRTPTPPDPEVMSDRADNYLDKLENSVARGEMPIEFAKKLQPLAKAADGKPNVFMLSRHADIGARPFDLILDLFKDQKFGVKTGEESAIQLNRTVPGEKNDTAKTISDARAEGAAHQQVQLQQRGLATA